MKVFSLDEEKEIEAEIYVKGIIKILKTRNGLNPQSKKEITDFTKDFEVSMKG